MHRILLALSLLFVCSCGGAEFGKREAGALGGGVLGAGLGAIIGHGTGNTAEGIAIGSAVGAIAGGLLGNEVDKQDRAYSNQEARIAEQDRILRENNRIIEELKLRGADVRSTDRGVIVNIPDVLFEFDSSELTLDAQLTTRDLSKIIKQYPERRIAVEGHTDSVGTIAYNKQLSEGRARTVSNELVAQGVSRRRISTYGFGESDPIASNRTDSGRRRNRRVEVIIENR